jgi:surface antigen
MSHARHHSGIGAILLSLFAAAALAACSSADVSSARLPAVPQAGQFFDRAPPPVAVVRDGPAGELIASPAPPLVPNSAVDDAIADSLRPWLTEIERRDLAEASQRAADQYTMEPAAWVASDPSGAHTATGTAVAVDDVFRAVRGQLCRDVRQTVAKDDKTHIQQVTLCRRDYGGGLYVWVLGNPDQ